MSRIKNVDGEFYNVKPLDLATLMINLHMAAQHPLIGHGDHEESLQAITERMNKGTVRIKKTDLEGALWACNMLDEQEELWTPYISYGVRNSRTEFTRLIERLQLPYGFKFDRFYNQILDKRRDRSGRE